VNHCESGLSEELRILFLNKLQVVERQGTSALNFFSNPVAKTNPVKRSKKLPGEQQLFPGSAYSFRNGKRLRL
jgi:hypothetical protein